MLARERPASQLLSFFSGFPGHWIRTQPLPTGHPQTLLRVGTALITSVWKNNLVHKVVGIGRWKLHQLWWLATTKTEYKNRMNTLYFNSESSVTLHAMPQLSLWPNTYDPWHPVQLAVASYLLVGTNSTKILSTLNYDKNAQTRNQFPPFSLFTPAWLWRPKGLIKKGIWECPQNLALYFYERNFFLQPLRWDWRRMLKGLLRFLSNSVIVH